MIILNEVREGNWVKFDNPKIWSKKWDGEKWKVTIDTLLEISSHGDWYSPILLTKEILDKCGFKNSEWEHKTKSDCLFVHNDIIHIMDARDKNYSFTSPCKYVHQLQNLYYCLTGNELEVVW